MRREVGDLFQGEVPTGFGGASRGQGKSRQPMLRRLV